MNMSAEGVSHTEALHETIHDVEVRTRYSRHLLYQLVAKVDHHCQYQAGDWRWDVLAYMLEPARKSNRGGAPYERGMKQHQGRLNS